MENHSAQILPYAGPLIQKAVKPVSPFQSQPVGRLIDRISAEPAPQYIFRGVVHPSVGAFYGPAKSGKTVLGEGLLMHIASGASEFLGQPLFSPHPRVLMIGMEEYYRNRTQRNANQIAYLTDHFSLDPAWIENFNVVDEDFPRHFSTDKQWDALKLEIDRLEPSVVVLDSLTRLSVDPIEESTVAQKLMRRLHDLAYSRGITLIVIHHAHKMDDRPLSMANMAGSRVFAQEFDFMLGVNRLSNGIRYIKDIAYRYAQEDERNVMTFSINNYQVIEAGDFHPELDLLKAARPAKLTGNDELVLTYIVDFTQQDASVMVSAAKLTEQFVASGVMSRPTLFACLTKLVKEGLVCKMRQGEYALVKPS